MHALVNQETGNLTVLTGLRRIKWPDGRVSDGASAGMSREVEGTAWTVREIDGAPEAFSPAAAAMTEAYQDGDEWLARLREKTAEELAAEAVAFIASAILRVDNEAEAARLQFITGGSGQALVYQRKEAQARACLATHDEQSPPAPGDFPALDAEVGITAADILGVATAVVAQADAWAPIGDLIEATRLSAKAAIVAANGDQTAITAVLDGLSWPAPA